MFDCDTHCYEPRDAITRYLPRHLLERAITTVRLANGAEVILADGRIASLNAEPDLGFDLANPPGSLKEMLKQMASGLPDDAYGPQPMRPEFLHREPRLRLLEEQGVQSCVLFPGGLAFAGENYIADTPVLYANVHAFNRWFDDEWGFHRDDRLYGTAVLSLRDLDLAIAETDHVLNRGARVVVLPTGPANGRSIADPYFDPVWARLNEARVVVAFHIMENWYNANIAPAFGLNPYPTPWQMSAWQWNNLYGERPIQDSVSALIFDNLFGRFPHLAVLCSEFGCEWVPHFVRHMDKSRGMGRNGPWIGGPLKERPSEIFRRHVRVVPYGEDDICAVVGQLGHADSIVMGSDYPHPEGLAEPAEFQKLISSLSDDTQRMILHGTAAAMFG